MSDSLTTVIAIMLAAVLLLIMPVITMADRTDDISKTDVETMTSNFVNEIRTLGRLTSENYYKFVEELDSTGNTYDIEMEFKILDENPGKKSTQAEMDKIGENVYYSVFTTQIQEALKGENKVYNLKEGDMVNVSVKNTNLTLSKQLKNFFYTVIGDDTYTLAASSSGIVLRTNDIQLASISNNVNDDKDGNNEEIVEKRLLVNQVEVGDYVAYDATNNYTYTSPKGTGMSHGNGDSDQKFTSSSNIKWKVLSKNETSGEVVLVSEKSIDTNGLKINGAIGYLYAEEELNKACSIYGHGVGADTSKTFSYITGNSSDENITGKLTGSGARSITLGDINKITGYETSGANTGIEKRYYPTTKTNTGYSTTAEDKFFEYECDPYNVNEYLNDKESNIYKLLFSEGYTYWCASRMVNEYETTLYFQVGFIDSSDVLGADVGVGDYNNFDNSYSDWYGIRPIVYLKTNLKTNGKDSNGAWTIIE